MRIRITTDTPGYTSLITPELQRLSKHNLFNLPWCYKGIVGDNWRNFVIQEWLEAAHKAPGNEVVLDCENAYSFINPQGELQWYRIGTDSYISDRQGTLDFLRKWAQIVKACKEMYRITNRSVSIYSYPNFPAALGVDVKDKEKWPDKRDRLAEDLAFLMTEKAFLSQSVSPKSMIEAYIYSDLTDFYQNLDAVIARCASVGLSPKIVLVSAFFIKDQMNGPAISFVGEKLVKDMAKAVRDLGLEPCFFRPVHGAALEAIARASVDL